MEALKCFTLIPSIPYQVLEIFQTIAPLYPATMWPTHRQQPCPIRRQLPSHVFERRNAKWPWIVSVAYRPLPKLAFDQTAFLKVTVFENCFVRLCNKPFQL